MKNKLSINFKTITSYALALLIVVSSFGFVSAVQAAEIPSLTIGSQTASNGDSIVVPIAGDDFSVASDVFGIQFRVNYNNTLLQYAGYTGATIGATTVNNPGSYISVTWDSDTVLELGGETFITLNFDVISSNNTDANLTFSNTETVDSVGEPIVTTFVDGVISLNPASNIATITSVTYTIGADTITNVPFETSKTTFLTVLTKGEPNQTWNDTGVSDPVATDDTLVVTAQDGLTAVVYVVTVNAAPDTTAPVITLLGDATVNLNVGDSYTDAGATALDDVDGDITADIVVGGDTVDTSTVGIYIISYNVSDAAGNPAEEVTRTVDIVAVPITLQSIAITTPATKLSYFVGESLDLTGLVVTGTYSDASTQVETITETNVTGFDSSTPVVGQTLTITVDEKTATYTVDIVAVLDIIAPVITLNGNNPMTIEVGSTFTDPGATAFDNVDGDITSSIIVSGSVDTSAIGAYIITYNVSDAAGNPATEVTRTVNGVDTTAPVIILLGDNPVNLYIGDSYTDAGATASDSFDGDITANIITTGLPINTTVPGTFAVTYNVSDVAGNHATELVRTVNVVDISTPIITLLGDNPITIEVGSEYVDAGATASDDVDGDITGSIIVVNSVDSNILGVYTVTYNVTDSSSNPAPEAVRTVNVVDTTNPIITLIGDSPAQVEVGYEYTDAGATANDNYDGDITSDIITTNNVDYHTVGTYSVTYDVKDSSDNSAEQVVRTVVVGPDLTLPVITLIGGDVSIQQGTVYTDDGATASDNADGDITSQIVTTGSVDTATIGTYFITYNVSDAAGNVAVEVVRTVNVVAVPVTFTLTYTAGANGSITGTLSQIVIFGTDGTAVTAVANVGYHFVNWNDSSTANPRTDTDVTEDISVTANFAVNPSSGGGGGGGGYYISISASAGTNGSISPTGSTSIAYGGSQTFTITPDTGYQIADVLVDGTSVGAVTNYAFSNIYTGHTISATFSVAIAGKVGDANGDGEVDKYDFALLMANWGETGTNVCDFNGDGEVDKYDFALLMANWGL